MWSYRMGATHVVPASLPQQTLIVWFLLQYQYSETTYFWSSLQVAHKYTTCGTVVSRMPLKALILIIPKTNAMKNASIETHDAYKIQQAFIRHSKICVTNTKLYNRNLPKRFVFFILYQKHIFTYKCQALTCEQICFRNALYYQHWYY